MAITDTRGNSYHKYIEGTAYNQNLVVLFAIAQAPGPGVHDPIRGQIKISIY